MKTSIALSALVGALGLVGCDRAAPPPPVTVTVPVPVAVPGPAGPQGDAGRPGDTGRPGAPGDTTVIVVPPAASQPSR